MRAQATTSSPADCDRFSGACLDSKLFDATNWVAKVDSLSLVCGSWRYLMLRAVAQWGVVDDSSRLQAEGFTHAELYEFRASVVETMGKMMHRTAFADNSATYWRS